MSEINGAEDTTYESLLEAQGIVPGASQVDADQSVLASEICTSHAASHASQFFEADLI